MEDELETEKKSKKQEFTQLPIRYNESNNKNIVVKSERLAFSKVNFTLNDYKQFNAFISQINPMAEYPSGLDFILTRSDLADLTGIDESNVHKFAVKTAKKFTDMVFEMNSMNDITGEQEIDIINLVERAKYKNGEFFLRFTNSAKKELLDLKRYGSFEIQHQKSISSKFGMVFLDLLCARWHWKKGQSQTITLRISEVKFACGIINEKGEHLSKSYSEFSAFRRKVVEPAIKDLNQAGDITIEDGGVEYCRQGRSYYSIKLKCKRIKKAEKTSQELPVKDRLIAHNINDDMISKLDLLADVIASHIDKNKEEVLAECLDYVESKTGINFFEKYLYEIVSLGVPFLPNWANPYSDMYKSDDQIIVNFVKSKIAPNAFEVITDAKEGFITQDTYRDIITNGAFSSYYSPKLRHYKNVRK